MKQRGILNLYVIFRGNNFLLNVQLLAVRTSQYKHDKEAWRKPRKLKLIAEAHVWSMYRQNRFPRKQSSVQKNVISRFRRISERRSTPLSVLSFVPSSILSSNSIISIFRVTRIIEKLIVRSNVPRVTRVSFRE